MLARSDPEAARELLRVAQEDVERQWRVYENRAAMAGHATAQSGGESNGVAGGATKGGARQ